MANSSFGFMGIGVQTVAETSVPPTKFLPVKDVDFPIDKEFIEVVEIRGSRQAYQTFDGPVRPSATFTSALYPAGATGVLLKALFGSVTTAIGANGSAGAAGYKDHTFGDAAALPYLSLERGDTKTSSGALLHERLPGCKIESIGFSCAYGEDVEISVTAQGLAFPEDPASHPASITYPAMEPMIFTGASVYVDGTPNDYFKNVNFDFTNTLERQEALRGVNEAFAMFEGGMRCTLSGTLIFADNVFYNAFKNATNLAVRVLFAGGTADVGLSGGPYKYEVEFIWPKVKVSSLGRPMTAGEVIQAEAEFEVGFDLATNKMVTPRMRNLEASGTYDT